MDHLGLTFHHLGLAVKTPEPALRFLSALGYRAGEAVFDPEQNVRLTMCHHAAMPDVEIIWPGDGPSPVDRMVARHKNGIVYHPCYLCADLDMALARMEEAGVHAACVSPPKPALLFAGERVSFYMVDGFGLIEILESRTGAAA